MVHFFYVRSTEYSKKWIDKDPASGPLPPIDISCEAGYNRNGKGNETVTVPIDPACLTGCIRIRISWTSPQVSVREGPR